MVEALHYIINDDFVAKECVPHFLCGSVSSLDFSIVCIDCPCKNNRFWVSLSTNAIFYPMSKFNCGNPRKKKFSTFACAQITCHCTFSCRFLQQMVSLYSKQKMSRYESMSI